MLLGLEASLMYLALGSSPRIYRSVYLQLPIRSVVIHAEPPLSSNGETESQK